MLVEDEEDVRGLLKARLERAGGFDILGEGSTAAEALELCREHRPHLVILDPGLPDLNGLTAVPGIRVESAATIVVIYTSDSTLATRNEAERAGAHAVVGKLDPFELLVGTIYRLLPAHAPQVNPALQDRAEFGQRMTALLDDTADDGEPWWRRRSQQSRRWMIVLLVVVVLPLLAAIAWVIAQLAGHGLGLG